MARTLFNKTSTNTSPLTATAPIFLGSIDGLAIQANYTDATPGPKVIASSAISGNVFILASHGLTTGTVGQFTTSGSLPGGISALTNYWVIVLTANTFSVASSLANALLGTAVTLSSAGVGNQTFTPTAISFALSLSASNDGINYVAIPNTSVTVTAAGSSIWYVTNPPYAWIEVVAVPTAGVLGLSVVSNAIVNAQAV